MIEPERFLQAARTVKDAYAMDDEFRKAAIASALSAITELKGSHSDDEVAASTSFARARSRHSFHPVTDSTSEVQECYQCCKIATFSYANRLRSY